MMMERIDSGGHIGQVYIDEDGGTDLAGSPLKGAF